MTDSCTDRTPFLLTTRADTRVSATPGTGRYRPDWWPFERGAEHGIELGVGERVRSFRVAGVDREHHADDPAGGIHERSTRVARRGAAARTNTSRSVGVGPVDVGATRRRSARRSAPARAERSAAGMAEHRAPIVDAAVAEIERGRAEPPTRSTARSRFGIEGDDRRVEATAVFAETPVSRSPATTCAFVTTRSGPPRSPCRPAIVVARLTLDQDRRGSRAPRPRSGSRRAAARPRRLT